MATTHTPVHSGHDSRKTRRVEFCPVTLTHDGCQSSGYMVDLSADGARIRLRHDNPYGVRLSAESPVDLDIRTPYGKAFARGRVLWAEMQENVYMVGVGFTEMSPDPTDPLRCLLDSAIS